MIRNCYKSLFFNTKIISDINFLIDLSLNHFYEENYDSSKKFDKVKLIEIINNTSKSESLLNHYNIVTSTFNFISIQNFDYKNKLNIKNIMVEFYPEENEIKYKIHSISILKKMSKNISCEYLFEFDNKLNLDKFDLTIQDNKTNYISRLAFFIDVKNDFLIRMSSNQFNKDMLIDGDLKSFSDVIKNLDIINNIPDIDNNCKTSFLNFMIFGLEVSNEYTDLLFISHDIDLRNIYKLTSYCIDINKIDLDVLNIPPNNHIKKTKRIK